MVIPGHVLALAALLAAPVGAARGDKDAVLLKNGIVVRGEILREDDGQGRLIIRTDFGRSTIPRARIEAISRADSPGRKEYAARRTKVRAGDADGWCELGRWARSKGLEVEAREAFAEALKADADHEGAHSALGHARLGDRWLTAREVREKLAQGYEVVEGRLVRKARYPRPKGRRIIPRKKLTYGERTRLEQERKRRERDAEAYRARRQKEYEGVPWPERFKVRTTHFVIECNSTPEVARRYAAMMEAIYAALDRRFRFPRIHHQRSFVFIHRNQEDFMEHYGAPWGVGGFYNPIGRTLHTYHGTFGLTGTTFNVLAHEGTHQFQGQVLWNFGNTPMWLIEGIAVYFGDGATLTRGGKVATERIPRDRLQHIQMKMREGKHTHLKDLVRLKRGQFGGTHYADAWSLIYFLANTDDDGKRLPRDDTRVTKGRRLLSEYWKIANSRKIEYKDFDALAKIHSGSVAALEKKWVDFIVKLPMPSAGEVLGNTFSSHEFRFELRAPGPAWQFYEEDRDELLVGMEKERTSATVEIFFRNNDGSGEEKDKPEEYIKFLTGALLPIHHESIRSEKTEFAGHSAYKVTYEDGTGGHEDASAVASSGPKAFMQRMALDRERKRKRPAGPPRRYVSYVVVEGDGIFRVTASAAKEEYAEVAGELEKAVGGFELILRRRW